MPPQDPPSNFEKFSEQELKAASWYVSHKLLLKKILIGFLIAVSAGLLGYGLYGLVNYYFIEGPAFEANINALIGSGGGTPASSEPQSAQIGSATILSPGQGKYDLVAKINNPNQDWRLEFDYHFVLDGKVLATKSGFILPGEEKFLIDLGVEAASKPRSAEAEIDNLRWQRIDLHEIPDYAAWRDERLNFVFEDVKFSPAVVSGKITTSRASFTAKNMSAYGFWDVGFYILLYRGSSLAGITYVTLQEFASGQTRQVEVSWFEPLSSVTQVKIIPEVNIFDPQVYIPVK